jgi:hypothetical protein
MLPIVKDHRTLVEKATNSPYTMDNLLPLLAAWPLLQAIEKAQSLDTADVVKTFEKMSSIETVFGKGKVTGQELVGINRFIIGPVPLARIQNGKVEAEFLKQ